MVPQGHSRSGSSSRAATTTNGLDTTSDMSNMLRKYKIVILGEQSSKNARQVKHVLFHSCSGEDFPDY
jgi:hypothetical protein